MFARQIELCHDLSGDDFLDHAFVFEACLSLYGVFAQHGMVNSVGIFIPIRLENIFDG